MRYFTVEYESLGRRWFAHVQASDDFGATRQVMANNRSAIWARIARELDREEYRRLTQ